MSTCIPRAPCINSAPIHTLAPVPPQRFAAFLAGVLVPLFPLPCLCGVASRLARVWIWPRHQLSRLQKIPSDIAYTSVSLFELSLHLLIQVLFFSFTSIPSSSTLWEIYFLFCSRFRAFRLVLRALTCIFDDGALPAGFRVPIF